MNKYLIASLVSMSLSGVALAESTSVVVKKVGENTYHTINVDSRDIQKLKTSGEYTSVEQNPWVSIPTQQGLTLQSSLRHADSVEEQPNHLSNVESQPQPNDPEYQWMYYWHSQDGSSHGGIPWENNLGSSEINAAVNKSEQNKKLRIAVIDGGFNELTDIAWSGQEGHNFFQAFGQQINAQWRSLDDVNDCETGHGNAVGGIIGASRNNQLGIAGIVDAELIPIRAFECNMARLSDLADAIRYAAGDSVKTAPVITKVDLINISSEAFNGECPNFLQDAINFAIDEGVHVYASAGNSNIEVTQKCEGVTLVGGSNIRRTKWVDSNFGAAVDFVVAGHDVKSYNLHYEENQEIGWWEGTSFATPNAVGIHGLALQHNPALSHEEIISFMKTTAQAMSSDIESADEDCSGDRCGVGLVNANRMMNHVLASSGDSPYVLRHALATENQCDQQLFLSDLGNAERLCSLYEVVVDPSGAEFEQNIQIVQVAKDDALNSDNAQLLIETKQSIVLLDDINLEEYHYGVKICESAVCNHEPIFPLDTELATVPANCQQD